MITMNKIPKQAKIYVAGHRGMVGSALLRTLNSHGFNRIITRTRQELDLTCQADVLDFFHKEKPDYVFLAAARVGGIKANNDFPAEFIYENLMIQTHVMEAARQSHVKRLLFLGSSCIYPKKAAQPMGERALLTGPLELTNEPYAIAKIAGIKLAESYNRQYGTQFRSVMPTNLYGPGDNFHPDHSHVIPGLMHRYHWAKINNDPVVVLWGNGHARREFLHVDDMAAACLTVMSLPQKIYEQIVDPRCSHINIGVGDDLCIKELALTLKEVTGYGGHIRFDPDKPEGPRQKCLDTGFVRAMGIDLVEGLEATYDWFLGHQAHLRAS